jgi:hypothetical protein
VSDEESGIEPRWLRIRVFIGVLAKVVRLAGSGALQLLNQAPAKERPEGCPVGAFWYADRVAFHDPLVEIIHAARDYWLVEKVGNAGELFGPPGLDEKSLLDTDAVIKVRRANDAFAEGPDLDQKVSALTTSPKRDPNATGVVTFRIGSQVTGVVRLPLQKLCMWRPGPQPILKALRGQGWVECLDIDGLRIFDYLLFRYGKLRMRERND